MYEELIKNLRGCREGSCKECRLGNRSVTFIDCMTALMEEAADAIEQLSNAGSAYGRGWTLGYDAGREESKPRWIPVTERLPETDGLYLVSVKNDHKRRYSKTAWYEKQSWFARQDVTHWMPLPSAPTEE